MAAITIQYELILLRKHRLGSEFFAPVQRIKFVDNRLILTMDLLGKGERHIY